MPQEDYPEAIHDIMMKWLSGETDKWAIRSTGTLRMTKKGVVDV